MSLKLKIIIGSTRAGRQGPAVAAWIYNLAKERTEFDTELVDLAEVNLPFLDEPNHPRLRKYTQQHTKDWSAKIDEADAFIMVTPEYNFSYPAPLKNAIDYLHQEWLYKPAAIVSYGGIAAGTRSAQALKLVLSALKMVPLTESVNIPFFAKYIDENGKFNANDSMIKSAGIMFNELAKWVENLKLLRKK